MSYHLVLQSIREILRSSHILRERGSIDFESEQLLISSIRVFTQQRISRLDLYTRMNAPLPDGVFNHVTDWARRRVQGTPLQYITGIQTFLDHEYQVSSDVLIPRPETEVLVSSALSVLSRNKSLNLKGIEIGIGSGAISVELLSYLPKLAMVATELSEGATKLALSNAKQILGGGPLGSGRLEIFSACESTQVWEPLEAKGHCADFLISNPPYLAGPDEVDLDVLHSEPKHALFSPTSDPLFFYRAIAARVRDFVRKGGFVFLEIPHERANEIRTLFVDLGNDVKILLDLNQRERVLVVELKE